MTHRYILEKYKGPAKRYTCPGCGHKRELTRYIDTETNEHIAGHVGKCNRADNCGYHYTPKQYFAESKVESRGSKVPPAPFKEKVQVPNPKINIPTEIFNQSISKYNSNKFVVFLAGLFGHNVVNKLLKDYKIGTCNGPAYWTSGSHECTVFWFINKARKIRYGQVKLFDDAGHTAKYKAAVNDNEHSSCTTGIHALLRNMHKRNNNPIPAWLPAYEAQDIKMDCFFGEHLLLNDEYKDKPIAIVEAPKTAIIASVYMPQYLWLATGAFSYLTEARCSVLMGKKITLFPDIDCFDKWKAIAAGMGSRYNITLSAFLEKGLNDEARVKGMDIADYIIKVNKRQYDTSFYETAYDLYVQSKKFINKTITAQTFKNIIWRIEEKIRNSRYYSMEDFVRYTSAM